MGRRHKSFVQLVSNGETYLHIDLQMHADTYDAYKKYEHKIKEIMWRRFLNKFEDYFEANYPGDSGECTFNCAWRGRNILLHNQNAWKSPLHLNFDNIENYVQWGFRSSKVMLSRRPKISREEHFTDKSQMVQFCAVNTAMNVPWGGVCLLTGLSIPFLWKKLMDPPKSVNIITGNNEKLSSVAIDGAFKNAWNMYKQMTVCFDIDIDGRPLNNLKDIELQARNRALIAKALYKKDKNMSKHEADFVFGIEKGFVPYWNSHQIEDNDDAEPRRMAVVHIIYRGGHGGFEEKKLYSEIEDETELEMRIRNEIETWLKGNLIAQNYNLMSRIWRSLNAE